MACALLKTKDGFEKWGNHVSWPFKETIIVKRLVQVETLENTPVSYNEGNSIFKLNKVKSNVNFALYEEI